jgi:O-antigen/teichoic acid export membrane protein
MTGDSASKASEAPTASPRKPSTLKTILFGTGTNYLRVFVRLIGGLFTFRLLFKTLGAQDFGFYQLMWSTIGYAVLLDFGFGASVQKVIAASLDFDDADAQKQRREAISTVFWSYVGLDLAVALIIALLGDKLLHLLHFDGGDSVARYRPVAIVFLVGVFIVFPFGVFREAQRGMNKIHVNNIIDTTFAAIQAAVVISGCYLHWSLLSLAVAAIGLLVLPSLVTAAVAMRDPDLRPRLRDFRWSQLHGLSAFSVYAYVITMTGLIMSQCDQLVIGAMISVEAIALYVPGFKLGQVYWSMATQMQDTLGPAAARLGSIKDALLRTQALRTLLITSQRWSVMIATLLALPLMIDMKGAVGLITGNYAASASTLRTSYLLVGNCVVGIVGILCTRRILMMINHHRVLLAFSIAEATLNLALSLWLTWLWKTCVGAAAGTFIATICVSLIGIPIYGCSVLGVSPRDFLLTGSLRGIAANSGAAIAAAIWWGAMPPWSPAAHFIGGCLLCACAALPGWWFIGMREDERQRALSALRRWRRIPRAPASIAAT